MSMSTSALKRPSAGTIGRWAILLIAAIYFIGPLVAAISFTVKTPGGGVSLGAYSEIFHAPPNGQISFLQSATYSLGITAGTIVLALGLMVPTQILLHLYVPRAKPVVEVISLLPLVFPPVVLVVGVSDIYQATAPSGTSTGGFVFQLLKWIRDDNHPLLLVILYAVMTLPFVYRTINTGIESINLRTLVEASRNLGASWGTTIVKVVMPALRTSMINAAFLCFALGMGEYTVTGILSYSKPFPVWLAQLPTQSGQEQAAVSVFSLILVEAALLVVSSLSLRRTKKGRA